MDFLPFFFGTGKLSYWYFSFYFLGIPLYLFGIILLFRLPLQVSPQSREVILTIFSFGYLILAFFSFINTILYGKITHQFFKGLFIFLGIQLLFWLIGGTLGNNYRLLSFYFIFFLFVTVYINLLALSTVQKKIYPAKKRNIQNTL